MGKLLLRMIREIKNCTGQFLSLVLVIAVGSFMFSGLFTTIISIGNGVDSYYEQQNMADLWVRFNGIDYESIQSISEKTGIEAEGRYARVCDAHIGNQAITLRLYSITAINAVSLISGSLPVNDNEIVVDSKFAEANALEPGSIITVKEFSGERDLTVCGIGNSPENAWKINNSTSGVVKQKSFAIGYGTESTVKSMITASETYQKKLAVASNNQTAIDELNRSMLSYTEVLIRTNDTSAVIELMSAEENYISHTVFDEHASVISVQGAIDIIAVISYIFPVIFFLVAAMIAFISMSKMVENQRMQIAVMEAIGISKIEIICGFMFYSILASAIGSFAFAAAGSRLIPALLTRMFTNRYMIPAIVVPVYSYLIYLPFVIGIVFSGAATLLAARSVFKEVPAQAMRPKPPTASKTILIERFSPLWNRTSYAFKLNCRNIFLNKRKILLSSVGVIGCVTLVLMGLSIQSSAKTMLHLYQESIEYDLVVSYENATGEEITKDCPVSLMQTEDSATLRTVLPEYGDSGLNIQVLPLGSDMVRYIDETGKNISIDETGVIIPRSFADKHGIQKGDSLRLSIDGKEFNVQISAVAEQYVGSTGTISDVYAEMLDIEYGYSEALIKLTNYEDTEMARQYFEAKSGVKSVTSIAELSGSAKDSLSMLNMLVRVIILAAAVLSVTVIYNITSIHIFERTRELATLMVLGYYKNEAGRLVFVENLVITGVGFLLGLPLGAVFFEGVVRTFVDAGINLPHDITMFNIAVTLILVYGLSIATNLLLKRRINRIDMVESLKGAE